jgi:hypothetical protein
VLDAATQPAVGELAGVLDGRVPVGAQQRMLSVTDGGTWRRSPERPVEASRAITR